MSSRSPDNAVQEGRNHPPAPTQDAASEQHLKRVVRASFAGTVVEWFDFAIYGYMATHIAAAFFNSEDPVAGLLETFAVFAVAFACRPLGGIFFGRLGDRVGRKRILAITVLLMSGSTAVIALIPSQDTIGVWAAVLLVLARCVQGFSAGGEYAGAAIYAVEHSPDDKRARWASAMPAATFASFALAAGLGALLSSVFSPSFMGEWGWRFLFLLSVPMGLVAFYIRSRLHESPEFEAVVRSKAERVAPPLGEVLRGQGGQILRLGGFIMLTALSFYIFSTYMSTFLTSVVGMPEDLVLLSTVVSLVIATAMAPAIGRVCDRVGRKRTMQFAGLSLALLTVPSYALAAQGTLGTAVVSQVIMAVGAVSANVVTAVLLSECFPTSSRYTSSGICYNITYAVFGGTAPYLATWLISNTGNQYAPALYVTVIALLACLVATFLHEETAGRPLPRE